MDNWGLWGPEVSAPVAPRSLRTCIQTVFFFFFASLTGERGGGERWGGNSRNPLSTRCPKSSFFLLHATKLLIETTLLQEVSQRRSLLYLVLILGKSISGMPSFVCYHVPKPLRRGVG